MVISGHGPGAINWESLRGLDTVVFLMAGYSLQGEPAFYVIYLSFWCF